MIQIGEYHDLEALRHTDFGWVLQNTENDEVLLPKTLSNKEIEEGDTVSVFVFKDSDNRLTATMQKAKVRLNEFAFLMVNQINDAGAFMDWGLDKDVLLPYREQTHKVTEGQYYVVRLVYDEVTERLYTSMRYNKYMVFDPITVAVGDQVEVLICDENAIGFKAIIENAHIGMIYKNQVFRPMTVGDTTHAWVKEIREDGKIDLSLQATGYEHIPQEAEKILQALESHNNFLRLHDKSAPQDIIDLLHMSKKQFKKAVGYLYKNKRINIIQGKGIEKNNAGCQ